ncbi:MAG TPA: chemotaxis protein CheX [Actinobacteria bacterium]|nr:chemotaxis protein CheX [Actinomycetota bacterium]
MEGTVEMLKAEFVNPFLEAACEVFETETGAKLQKGPISVQKSSLTSQEVSVLLGITGEIHGQVIYGISSKAAKRIASAMIGRNVPLLDELAQSAISELGNMITGLATVKFGESYSSLAITPPTLIIGQKVLISTIDIQRLYVVLMSEFGDIEVSIALKERVNAEDILASKKAAS